MYRIRPAVPLRAVWIGPGAIPASGRAAVRAAVFAGGTAIYNAVSTWLVEEVSMALGELR